MRRSRCSPVPPTSKKTARSSTSPARRATAAPPRKRAASKTSAPRATTKSAASGSLLVNRAPVLTLWAAVVAERLGYSRDAALGLGKAMAGRNAYAKGVAIGLMAPSPKREKAARSEWIRLLDVPVRVTRTAEGVRSLDKDEPVTPESVERYLDSKFGDALPAVQAAMEKLARSIPKAELDARARALYERFRPEIPRGQRGWGAKGVLDVATILSLIDPR